MDVKEIHEVLSDVFGSTMGATTVNGWVSIRCPLSPWTHERGKDGRPSAGVSIQPNSTSVFSCFTCGNKAPFHGMLRKYADFSGEDLSDLIEEMEQEAYLGARTVPEWDSDAQEEEPLPVLDKAVFLDLYDSAAGHPYLASRGISDATARRLQLMLDPSDPADGEERILFPVFGPNGDLHGLTGRAVSKTARLKVRDYMGLKKARCLLGAHLITETSPDKILVVEGLFDYANAWECGQPAVAAMHSDLTPAQLHILQDFGLPLYPFFDNDEAGDKGVKTTCTALADNQPVLLVEWPEVWLEDPNEDGGGHWLKDPGELTSEEFEEMIRGRRLYAPRPMDFRAQARRQRVKNDDTRALPPAWR